MAYPVALILEEKAVRVVINQYFLIKDARS
jgi:hypothetical protein